MLAKWVGSRPVRSASGKHIKHGPVYKLARYAILKNRLASGAMKDDV